MSDYLQLVNHYLSYFRSTDPRLQLTIDVKEGLSLSCQCSTGTSDILAPNSLFPFIPTCVVNQDTVIETVKRLTK